MPHALGLLSEKPDQAASVLCSAINRSGEKVKIKGQDIYRHLQGNQNSSGLQFEVAYRTALSVCSAAQLAAVYCPNRRILHPQSAATQTHLRGMPQPAALWPSPCNVLRQRLTIFSSEYY